MISLKETTPWHVLRQDEILSTSTSLKRLASWGARHGTVVLAKAQSAGHGRTGRHWLAPPGALLISLLLRPTQPLPLLSLLAAVAVAEAADLPGLHLKWPNDLLIGDAKVGGILVEGRWAGDRPDYLIVGVGVNVAAPPALGGTTCLRDHGSPLDAEALARRLLAACDRWLNEPDAAVIAAWRARCRMWGAAVTVHPAGAEPWPAVVAGLAPDGALLVRATDGTPHALRSGEVRLTAEDARLPT
jgi:BirA family biotin operon repressor/biotin-[acetyl-CoA-carboxylase] ligase